MSLLESLQSHKAETVRTEVAAKIVRVHLIFSWTKDDINIAHIPGIDDMVAPPAPAPARLSQIKAQALRHKPMKRASKKSDSGQTPGHPPSVKRPKEKSPVAATPDAPTPEMWSWATLVDTAVTSHPAVFTRDTK